MKSARRAVISATVAAILCGTPVKAASTEELQFVNVPPPTIQGNVWHNMAGVAKYACYKHFIEGQPLESSARKIAANVYGMDTPFEVSARLRNQSLPLPSVTVTAGKISRIAVLTEDQGCIVLPNDGRLLFTPERIKVSPSAGSADLPAGDGGSERGAGRFERVLAAGFAERAAETAAVLVYHDGKLVGERYAEGADRATLFHGWSMTKSINATMMGVLENQGKLRMYELNNIPEWQGDARKDVRLGDLLRMQSGIRCVRSDDYPPSEFDIMPYPEYPLVWTDATDGFAFIRQLPQLIPPGILGIYKDCDPTILGAVIRRKIEQAGADYLQWPQSEIFDKIGVRSMRIGTDAAGNFVVSADGFATARDWGRLGLLWLNRGVAPSGERLISERFVDFVSGASPRYLSASGKNRYAAGFWSSITDFDLPPSSYFMLGGSYQAVFIVPAWHMVVVRLGFDALSADEGAQIRSIANMLKEAAAAVSDDPEGRKTGKATK